MSQNPTPLADRGFLEIGDHRLEYRMLGPRPEAAPTLVLLHEGLGSVDLWGDFQEQLAEASGLGVFAYSRIGYGRSSKATLPRPLTYMHEEARLFLPQVLDAIGLRRGVIVGHSDGASIASIHAGSFADPRLRGFVLIAPHFIIEDVTIRAIREFRDAFDHTDLRERLGRWHDDIDHTVHGWSDVWLGNDINDWNITGLLPGVTKPMLVVQGEFDHYGTMRQVEIAQQESGGPVEVAALKGIMHAPHREAPEETLRLVMDFSRRVLS